MGEPEKSGEWAGTVKSSHIVAGILLAVFMAAAAIVPAAAQGAPSPALPEKERGVMERVNRLYLGYVLSSSPQINDDARRGLETLANVVAARTAVEPAGVVALDAERDELGLFPFIYWPVAADAKQLSESAQKKVQNYIDTGGVIVFDVRDQSSALSDSKFLRRLLGSVNIKPLTPMNRDHTLTRAFYLVAGLPGSGNSNPVWVEAPEAENKESVSAVIVGASNWAGAFRQ